MLNKFKNWCDKPYTHGEVLKWSAVSMAVVVVEYAVLFGIPYVSGKIDEFKTKKQEDEVEYHYVD